MVILLMILLSLCAIYFTRFLLKRKMKTASVMVASLYFYLIIWIFAIFILDALSFGYLDKETHTSLIYGSDIYHSFVNLNSTMSAMPLPIHKAIASIAAMTIITTIILVFHGLFEMTKVVISLLKNSKNNESISKENEILKTATSLLRKKELIRLHCRMNC